MGTFTTKLKLGGKAFGVSGGLDPAVMPLTVGQIRVVETLPRYRFYCEDPCYLEEYMCIETGVGSGTVWTYGKNIFATEEEANAGVVIHRQRAHKERAERDAQKAKQEAWQRDQELRTLARLREKYGASADAVGT